MMIGVQKESSAHESRRNRLIRDPGHDLYGTKGKNPEPTVCPACSAVYRKGHWHWETVSPSPAASSLCPACHRVQQKAPAGYLTLKGPFLQEHQREIVHLLRNEEAKATALHALKRIMDIQPTGEDRLEVTTTDAHLARSLGEALYRAYRGELLCRYEETTYAARITWER